MLGKMLNIPSTVDDPNYRYKMPRLEIKIEGRGNGIKTNITNLYDVSKYLRVNVDYPLKFLGYELGTQTTFKQGKNDATTIINGQFTEADLRKALDQFILKYILCKKCGYPELRMFVKSEKIYGQCNSCGEKNVLDNVHRTAAYIVKNPPQDQTEFKKEDPKDVTKAPAPKTDAKAPAEEVKAEVIPKKEESKDAPSKTPSIVLDDLQKDSPILQELVNKVRDTIAKDFGAVENFDGNDDAVTKIWKVIKRFKVPEDRRDRLPYIIFFGCFDEGIAKQIKKYSYLLSELLGVFEFKANKEIHILVNLEYLFFVKCKGMGYEKYIPTILKFFYDGDLLMQEFILSWAEGKEVEKLKQVFHYDPEFDAEFKKHSASMIEWLKADEEEEEEEETTEKPAETK